MDLKKNLEYAASVLESLYMEETRQGFSSSVLLLSNYYQHEHISYISYKK